MHPPSRINHPLNWHPFSSKFEKLPIINPRSLCREGDDLRRRLEGKRILEILKVKVEDDT